MLKRVIWLFLFFTFVGSALLFTTASLHAQSQQCDANGDGIVDGIDYYIWVLHYGKSTTNGVRDGDFNGNGLVDGLDFALWLNNYGKTITPPSTNTPTLSQQPLGNIALNKIATASSHDTDGPNPGTVVDGNLSTRWSSAWSQPQWIQIDLGAQYPIVRVVLRWEKSYGKAYRIEVSNDTSTWTSIYSTTTSDGTTDDLQGLSGSGRYIRMYGITRACDGCSQLFGFSLWEFEVYANGSGITSTPHPTSATSITATKTPTPTGSVCYVKVAGYLYNMQPAVGISLRDPNTGKTRTHSRSNFNCGTPAAPTDMTNTYLGKHNGMGCAQRLAPYIVTPPAPDDPTCQ